MNLILLLLAFSNPNQPVAQLEEQYKAHVRFLADDLLEGRETAQRGQKLAALYLASQMAAHGAKPAYPDSDNPYFQEFELEVGSVDAESVKLSADGKVLDLKYGEDFSYMMRGGGSFDKTAPAVFIGYGIQREDYNDYKGMDVKGKWLFMLNGQPEVKDKPSPFSDGEVAESNPWLKLRSARDAGAVGVIYVSDRTQPNDGESMRLPGSQERSRAPFPIVPISRSAFDTLMGSKNAKRVSKAIERINASGKPRSFDLKKRDINLTFKQTKRTVTTENVVAILPGSDPELKDEYIVVSAHYDHEGIKGGRIYNGADDNASGSATLLLMAEHMADQKRRRSMILLLVSAEEKGLLGSRYFVNHPPVPIKQIVGNLNMDMLGRSADGSVGLIPAKIEGVTTINEVVEAVNADGGHNISLRKDMDRYHRRSDHYNFTTSGVPALFFFTGTHEDYHQPTDDWDKLHYDELARFYNFFEDVTLELLNRDEKPEFIKMDTASEEAM